MLTGQKMRCQARIMLGDVFNGFGKFKRFADVRDRFRDRFSLFAAKCAKKLFVRHEKRYHRHTEHVWRTVGLQPGRNGNHQTFVIESRGEVMSYLQVFKRIIPFFLTFAAGLLIASIFVPITGPSLRNADRVGKWRHHKECKREKESLRRERDRLKEELEQLRREAADVEFRTLQLEVPYVRVEAPVPPPPPTVK